MRRDGGATIGRYRDLDPLRIGVKLGAGYFARFDADTALNKDAARDQHANFRKPVPGRLDAVLIPGDQGEAMLASMALQDVLAKAPIRHGDPPPRAAALSRKSAHAAPGRLRAGHGRHGARRHP